ncbi:MAG: ATP-binding cassette domain-containing protein, partial [Chloroflexi bacterium]|nr:ATP-binding cassette domain-containing protein [Chloroflexota bacterium]
EDLTARENLAFAADMLGTPERSARVGRALVDIGLSDRADERVGGFSAGMRKRLALGRILLGQASVVLLDEPMAALDPDGMSLVEQLLTAWREVGVSVLVAAHSTERLDDHLDARVTLERGLVTELDGSGVTSAPPTIPALEARPVAAR